MANIFKPNKSTKYNYDDKQGKIVTLDVTGMDHLARGVSSNKSEVFFIRGALPGETVDAKIIHQKGKVFHAEVVKILEPSDVRQTPFCRHFEQCGGCETQHCDSAALLEFKRQAIERQILHTACLPNSSAKATKKSVLGAKRIPQQKSRSIQDWQQSLPWQSPINSVDRHYRHKARLAIDARNPKDIRLGFRQQSNNQIFSLKQCPILVPELETLILPLQTLLNQMRQPLNIGHITLLKGEGNELKMGVHDVHEGNELKMGVHDVHEEDKLKVGVHDVHDVLVGVHVVKTLSVQDQQTMLEFAKHHQVQLVFSSRDSSTSPTATRDTGLLSYSPIESIELQMHLDDFVQVNARVNQAMVAQAIQWLALTKDDNVLDLFCGIGNFSLPMALHSKFVMGIEGVTKMVQRATKNAQNNAITNCEFEHWDLSESDWVAALVKYKFNKILLDPSREGAKQTIANLSKLAPTHILYVSCNPATFARDAASLMMQNYRLEKIALMDMFPQTAHTELMALFMPSNSMHA
jgi:23S rRNA (uracil1939-C5)-methyltransferase